MKKNVMRLALPLLVLIGLSASLPAEEIFVGEVPYLEAEMFTEDSFNIKYETDTNEMYIQTGDWSGFAWIKLNSNQIETLRATVSKALDWCKIAHDNNSQIDKELPNSSIETDVIWQFGDDIYKNSNYNKLNLKFLFASFKLESGGVFTSMLMASSKVSASSNKYVTYSFPKVVLLENELDTFKKVISEDSINSAIAKYEESKKAEDLFN